jgi:hypothetical protein
MVRETGLTMLIKQIVLCIRKGVCAGERGSAGKGHGKKFAFSSSRK